VAQRAAAATAAAAAAAAASLSSLSTLVYNGVSTVRQQPSSVACCADTVTGMRCRDLRRASVDTEDVGSRWYYGSDAVLSPLHYLRNPGEQAYDGSPAFPN
jgi:hypothetical protein